MKKLLAVLILAIALIVSCTKAENVDIDGLKIVAVDFPSYDAVRAILGSEKEVSMLLPPGSESHSYEPTAKDMIEISNADLVVFADGYRLARGCRIENMVCIEYGIRYISNLYNDYYLENAFKSFK